MSDAASATTGYRSAEGPKADYAWLAQAGSLVPADKLYDLANSLSSSYRNAEPFPHVVIDNLFDDAMLEHLLAVFPGPKDRFWHRFDAEREVKLALDAEDVIPVPLRLFLYFLNGSLFINFLEGLTGIPGLIPDPHWFGGGLHQIERHGKLAVHADFNRQSRLKLDRRLNLLVYLNKDWKSEYRGDLELWDRDMTACVKKIAPLFNRMVIFSTTDFSYHGHPDELLCPPDRCRRSMALYYYSNGRPADELSESHSTLFQPRPQESFKGGVRRRVKPFVPPVLFDLYDRFTS
jgi:hypothetical protein